MFGAVKVLMHQPLSDAAKCLGFSIVDISTCNWSWGWCYWGSLMKPRSYVEVTENAIEVRMHRLLRCRFI